MTGGIERDRRLGLLDGLILGASLALGIWVWEANPSYLEYLLGLREGRAGVMFRLDSRALPKGDSPLLTLTRWRNLALNFAQMVLPFVTIGVALATFRRRANRGRRALRNAGLQTTAVAAIYVSVSLVNEFVLRRFKVLQVGYEHNPLDSWWGSLAVELSLAIAALWVVLVAGRLWRAVPHWTDRLGRALGLAWIAYTPLNVVLGLYNS